VRTAAETAEQRVYWIHNGGGLTRKYDKRDSSDDLRGRDCARCSKDECRMNSGELDSHSRNEAAKSHAETNKPSKDRRRKLQRFPFACRFARAKSAPRTGDRSRGQQCYYRHPCARHRFPSGSDRRVSRAKSRVPVPFLLLLPRPPPPRKPVDSLALSGPYPRADVISSEIRTIVLQSFRPARPRARLVLALVSDARRRRRRERAETFRGGPTSFRNCGRSGRDGVGGRGDLVISASRFCVRSAKRNR